MLDFMYLHEHGKYYMHDEAQGNTACCMGCWWATLHIKFCLHVSYVLKEISYIHSYSVACWYAITCNMLDFKHGKYYMTMKA